MDDDMQSPHFVEKTESELTKPSGAKVMVISEGKKEFVQHDN